MNLVELVDKKGWPCYVNPEKIAFIQQYREGIVLISFDSAGSDFRDHLEVRGNVEYVAAQVINGEDK